MKAATASLYNPRRSHADKRELADARKRGQSIPAGSQQDVQRPLPSPPAAPPRPAPSAFTCCMEEVVHYLQQGSLNRYPHPVCQWFQSCLDLFCFPLTWKRLRWNQIKEAANFRSAPAALGRRLFSGSPGGWLCPLLPPRPNRSPAAPRGAEAAFPRSRVLLLGEKWSRVCPSPCPASAQGDPQMFPPPV